MAACTRRPHQYKGFLHCDCDATALHGDTQGGTPHRGGHHGPAPPLHERHVYLFDPDYADRSLGTFAILSQLELARRTGRSWLYLGYLVEACRKMNYKRQYLPHELLVQGEWKISTPSPSKLYAYALNPA